MLKIRILVHKSLGAPFATSAWLDLWYNVSIEMTLNGESFGI